MKVKVVKNRRSESADITPAAQIIAACFAARTQAHILHLQSTSYAQHVALASFYEGIIGLADAYAEGYQGRYGIIPDYPIVSFQGMDATTLISELRTVIDNTRVNAGVQSELQNAIDSIQDLCNSTLYKLQNLQ